MYLFINTFVVWLMSSFVVDVCTFLACLNRIGVGKSLVVYVEDIRSRLNWFGWGLLCLINIPTMCFVIPSVVVFSIAILCGFIIHIFIVLCVRKKQPIETDSVINMEGETDEKD